MLITVFRKAIDLKMKRKLFGRMIYLIVVHNKGESDDTTLEINNSKTTKSVFCLGRGGEIHRVSPLSVADKCVNCIENYNLSCTLCVVGTEHTLYVRSRNNANYRIQQSPTPKKFIRWSHYDLVFVL